MTVITRQLLRSWPETTRTLIALCLGLVLLWLAIPRTVVAFMNLPGDPVRQAIQTGGPVTGDDLHGLVSSRENALQWNNGGRIWADLGLAYMLLARQAGYATVAGTDYLEMSAKAIETGLSKAPADPYAWTRKSFIDLQLEGPGRSAKNALILSLFTGPYERSLAHSRIQYAFSVWHRLNASQQAMVHTQIEFLDRFNRSRLVQIIGKNRHAQVIALTALASHPERQAILRAKLKQ